MPKDKKRGLKDRLMAVLQGIRSNAAEPGVSDAELRGKLNDALRAVEPGFMGVAEVYPAENLVIYEVCPEDYWMTMRRGYTTAADGTVSLAAAGEEVETVITYEPVLKAAVAAQPTVKETVMSTPKEITERMKNLAANKHSAVKNEAALALLSECELKALEAQVATAEAAEIAAAVKAAEDVATKKAADEEAAKLATAATKPLTRAEILAADPSIAAIVAEHEARVAKEKTDLVTSLKAASSALTEAQLNAKPIEQLRELAAFAKVETKVDYSGMGAPAPRAASGEDYTPPNPYEKGLKALRASETVN